MRNVPQYIAHSQSHSEFDRNYWNVFNTTKYLRIKLGSLYLNLVLFAVEGLDVLVRLLALQGGRLHAHNLPVHVQHLEHKKY